MSDALITEPGMHISAEIAEQPARWIDVVTTQEGPLDVAAEILRQARPGFVVLVARGTSDHAALYGQYLLEGLLGVPVALATPSVRRNDSQSIYHRAMAVVALSQSGSSPDLVATVQDARSAGVPTIAFTNDTSSALATAAAVHVDLSAGPELSVAATKSYTAELIALYAWINRAADVGWTELQRSVQDLADAARGVITSSAQIARSLSDELRDTDRALVIGRGLSMATAREAALKLMETSMLPASGWSAADAKHGPLGQVVEGTPVFLLNRITRGRASVEDLIPLLAAKGARIHALAATAGSKHLSPSPLTDVMPTTIPDDLVPMLEIIPFQQLARELALHRGLNPDAPAGLSKITRTL
ncbi:SIS domain-containing protein [Diaminobutyricibacter tongyongensis]|uniref:SIS domain-containing protein n=1 Tax=Leifsonia tongyongensis TaxID=1268043 RepID=A0A6L9XWJ7_9MICO|nr:SIS domain-containing protein [Diaminobutyricibacter tongyongensis]NEN05812.1 SIS domain-containing protein [Diaminobutyricibacter tongyongensis]